MMEILYFLLSNMAASSLIWQISTWNMVDVIMKLNSYYFKIKFQKPHVASG